MAKVFVSYARENLTLAKELHHTLRQDHHDVFVDVDPHKGTMAGEAWRDRLHRELRRADAVVCIVTSAYCESPWCAYETGLAEALGCRVIPVQAEPDATSPLLTERQYIVYDDGSSWPHELAAVLRDVDAVGGLSLDADQSPFPGLRPYDTGMARYFVGRDAEIRKLSARLRVPGERPDGSVLLVVGPSGCGKSSLVRAGLLARLVSRSRPRGEARWEIVAPFSPGADPIDALAMNLAKSGRMAGLDWSMAETRERLSNPRGLASVAKELLVATSHPGVDRLLLVVDQGEELFTRTGPEIRSQFAALVGRAAAGPVQVVLTLRSEFQDQLLAVPELAGKVDTFALQPLDREMLRLVVQEPARRAKITVDRELVERLVADTGSGEALPLLAFTLNELAVGVTAGGSLSAEKYDEMRGVRGALAKHADETLENATAFSGLSEKAIIAGLVRMVDDPERRTARRVDLADLADLPVGMAAAFDVFVDGRLLVSTGSGTSRTFGVAHEALFTAWRPLDIAVAARADGLAAARSVERAAAEWQAGGQADHFLWGPIRLAEAGSKLGLDHDLNERPASAEATEVQAAAVHLSADGREFLAATRHRVVVERRRQRRRRNRVVAVLSVLLALALAAAGLAGWQRTEADRVREVAEQSRLTETSRKLAREAETLRDQNPRLSLALSVLAFDLAPDLPEARDSVLSAQATYYNAVIEPGLGAAHAVAVSPDATLLAAAHHDDAVSVWTMPDRKPLPPLLTADTVYDLAFSPDGTMLAAAVADGTVVVWRVGDSNAFERLTIAGGGPAAAKSVSFSRSGQLLAVGGQDRQVHLWDTRSWTSERSLPQDGLVTAVAFSPTEENQLAVAVATDVRTGGVPSVKLWDTSTLTGNSLGSEGLVRTLAFSPDGARLATGSSDGTVSVWDVSARAPVAADNRFGEAVQAVAYSPDNRTVAAASEDGAVRLWDPGAADDGDGGGGGGGGGGGDSGEAPTAVPRELDLFLSLTGPTTSVLDVAFGQQADVLVSAGEDSVVGLWTVSGPPDLNLPEIRDAALFTRDGNLITADRGDHLVRWRVAAGDISLVVEAEADGGGSAPPPGGRPRSFSMAASADGRLVALPFGVGPPGVWDQTDSSITRLATNSPGGARLDFSASGELVTTARDDNRTIEVWDPPYSAPDPVGDEQGGQVNAIAVSPPREGRRPTVAVGRESGVVVLYEYQSGFRRSDLLQNDGAPVESLAYRGDGAMLAVGGRKGQVTLWAYDDEGELRRVSDPGRGPTDSALPVVSMSFSPDHRYLASVGADGVVRLWEVQHGDLVARLFGRPGTTAVTFASGLTGVVLATTDQNGTPVLWDTDPARVSDRICSGQPLLTREEWTTNVPGEPYRPLCG